MKLQSQAEFTHFLAGTGEVQIVLQSHAASATFWADKSGSETKGAFGKVGARKEEARGRGQKLFTSNSKHKLLFFLPSVDTADQTLCH